MVQQDRDAVAERPHLTVEQGDTFAHQVPPLAETLSVRMQSFAGTVAEQGVRTVRCDGTGCDRTGKPCGGILGLVPQEPYDREFEAAVDRRRARTPGVSRLLVLCAVLCGLFLMHGAPASAAEGCHGAMAVPSDAAMSMTTGAGHTALTDEHGTAHAAATMPGMTGESCVSTHARDRLLPLLMALGLVVLAVWVLGRRRTAVRGPARRGPPFAGRDLLLQVCIART
ncbi:hypothetical protein ACFVYE_13460 [Streptomyces sp. NPDC058239]|uniref:hypothetical protein n=1 Tax=Streptomyces sp. NPDC058239 TaxID=3346395 RepID=UPI0036E5AC92